MNQTARKLHLKMTILRQILFINFWINHRLSIVYDITHYWDVLILNIHCECLKDKQTSLPFAGRVLITSTKLASHHCLLRWLKLNHMITVDDNITDPFFCLFLLAGLKRYWYKKGVSWMHHARASWNVPQRYTNFQTYADLLRSLTVSLTSCRLLSDLVLASTLA